MSTANLAARFVRACVMDPEVVPEGDLEGIAHEVRDWNEVADLSEGQRVAEFVQAAIRRVGVKLPRAAAERLQSACFRAQAQRMLLDAALVQVLAGFDSAGIATIVLKGPALGRAVYPNPAFRPYSDLDLTIRATDESKAVDLLLSAGFREVTDAAHSVRDAHAHRHEGMATFHRKFADSREQVVIELHLDPLQLGLRPVADADRWARATTVPNLPGVLMLSKEDQLVHLAVHAHKHGFSHLIWLKDLDVLLRRFGAGLDWDLVSRTARQEGVAASVWYALQLTGHLFATPLPAASNRLRPSLVVRFAYGRVWPRDRIANLQGHMHRRAVQFDIAESWRGILPSLVLMGRRLERARLVALLLWAALAAGQEET